MTRHMAIPSPACPLAAFLLALPAAASAHPHIWIEATVQVAFQAGAPATLRQTWAFDAFYSAFTVQQFDADRNGRLDEAELRQLAAESGESLKSFGFFTHLNVNGAAVAVPAVADMMGEMKDDRLHLSFTVDLPPSAGSPPEFTLSLFDPTYYVALGLSADAPVAIEGAPAGCRAQVVRDAALVRAFAPQAMELVRVACAPD